MARGQVSIELFFAMLLVVVLFLWFMNYAGVLSSGFGEVSLRSQAAAIASSVAKVSSAACAHQVNASLQLPCVSRAGQRRAIALSAGNSTKVRATIAGEATYAEMQSTCPVSVSLSSICTNGTVGDWICIKGLTGAVSISNGRC